VPIAIDFARSYGMTPALPISSVVSEPQLCRTIVSWPSHRTTKLCTAPRGLNAAGISCGRAINLIEALRRSIAEDKKQPAASRKASAVPARERA
jgi:hypothetical protein